MKLCLESDETTTLWQNESKTSTFYSKLSVSIQTEQLLWKKFSDLITGFQSDEMTAVWLNKISTFTFLRHFQIEYQTEKLL